MVYIANAVQYSESESDVSLAVDVTLPLLLHFIFPSFILFFPSSLHSSNPCFPAMRPQWSPKRPFPGRLSALCLSSFMSYTMASYPRLPDAHFCSEFLGGPSPVNRAKQPWIKYPRARFRPSSLLVHIPQPTITSKFQSAMAIPNSTPPVWSLSTWMAIPKPINL